ncbi:MAG TPA: hypothetical protein VGM87_16525 [Roseomonas sp.]|jgi:acyl carrier protein
MDSAAFLKRVAEALDHGGALTRDQAFETIETWDSLGMLSIMALLEELGVDVDPEAVGALRSMEELIAMAGPAVHD